MTMRTIGLRVVAEGEVRDSTGKVVDRPQGYQDVQVPVAELAKFTDDELRAAGIGPDVITEIRRHEP